MISIIISTFNRDQHLEFGLQSIIRQKIQDLEIIVVNDGLPNNTESICQKYGAKCFFIGQRNTENNIIWRPPCLTYNYGVKQSNGDIIIITCAEMYHLENCIETLIKPLESDNMAICIPNGKYDAHPGSYFHSLCETNTHNEEIYNKCLNLRNELPFLMAIDKQNYYAIGGYDEKMLNGVNYDDDDFIYRLKAYGCHCVQTNAKCVHLWHGNCGQFNKEKISINERYFQANKTKIIRNEKGWGIIN